MRPQNLRNSIQVAVIGGNGFLGRAIIHRLSGYPNMRIFSVDNRTHGVIIDTSKSKAIIQQIHLDVSNEGAIQSFLMAHPVDVIIYAAGFEAPTDGLPLTFQEDSRALVGLSNTLAALGNMELEPEEPKPYFLYVSSWAVYGTSKSILTEESKEFPGNIVGMLRLTGEDLVKRVATKAGARWAIARPTEVYGPKHFKELRNQKYWPGYLTYYVDKFVKREPEIEVWSPDTQIDLVNVNHFSKVIVTLIQNQSVGIFNISSGSTLTVKELVKKISEAYGGGQPKITYSDRLKIEHMRVDSSKSLDLVPYKSDQYVLEDFLRDYIKVRRYEIAKDMAVQDALSEPVVLDIAALEARQTYEARKARRKLTYGKIKEIAGEEFFKINVGVIPKRFEELEALEMTPELLEAAKAEQLKNENRLELLGESKLIEEKSPSPKKKKSSEMRHRRKDENSTAGDDNKGTTRKRRPSGSPVSG